MAVPTIWIAPSADGRLEVFVVGSNAGEGGVKLWHLYQIAPAGGWSQWVSHGSAPGEFNNWHNPVVARNSDRRLELFMGFDAQTWQIWQTSRNGGWTPQWTQHPAPPGHLATGFGTLILRPDGRLQLFAIGVISAQSNALLHIMQTAPSQGWTSWASLGAPAAAGGLNRPAVAQSADGRLEVFAVGRDGALWHIWQTSVNGGWSSWVSHGAPPGTRVGGLRQAADSRQLAGAPRTVRPRRRQGAVAHLAGSPQRRLVELGPPRHPAGHHFYIQRTGDGGQRRRTPGTVHLRRRQRAVAHLAGRPQRRLVTVDLPRPSAIHQPAVSRRRVEHTGLGAELRRTPRTVRRRHEHRAVAHLADRPQSGMVGVAVARQPTRIQDIRTVVLRPESSARALRSRLPDRLIRWSCRRCAPSGPCHRGSRSGRRGSTARASWPRTDGRW